LAADDLFNVRLPMLLQIGPDEPPQHFASLIVTAPARIHELNFKSLVYPKVEVVFIAHGDTSGLQRKGIVCTIQTKENSP
jgi:hypothetical protein